MGPRGIESVSQQCAQKAHYAARKISELAGFSLPFSAPFFNEFVVRASGDANALLKKLANEKGIDGGLALSRYDANQPNDFLVCVTETNTRDQIDALIDGLKFLTTKTQRHEAA
jgi:glycine dehydrogenase subunit 1